MAEFDEFFEIIEKEIKEEEQLKTLKKGTLIIAQYNSNIVEQARNTYPFLNNDNTLNVSDEKYQIIVRELDNYYLCHSLINERSNIYEKDSVIPIGFIDNYQPDIIFSNEFFKYVPSLITTRNIGNVTIIGLLTDNNIINYKTNESIQFYLKNVKLCDNQQELKQEYEIIKKEKFKKQLEKLQPYINLLDTYNFNYDITFDEYINITIKFDKLTITNSENLVHDIYDLYFTIIFNQYGKIHNYTIRRGILSYIEKEKNYLFSHWNNHLCFGSDDSEIALLDKMLKSTFNELCFEQFLLLLPEYLSWESIEGRPYKYIKDLQNLNQTENSISSNDLDQTIDIFVANINDFDFILSSNEILVNSEDINTILNDNISKLPESLLSYKVGDSYYKITKIIKQQQQEQQTTIKVLDFKEKPVYLKLIPNSIIQPEIVINSNIPTLLIDGLNKLLKETIYE